jgi:hypothetical protein
MFDKIKIGSDELDLDAKKLSFNEATLTNYIQQEGGYYNNIGSFLARAELLHERRLMELDALKGEKFKEYKDEGGSDKYADARTYSDPDVQEARSKVASAKFKVRLIQQHLRAWDKNHENAQSLGHQLRKEMDKLNGEIRGGGGRDYEFMVDKVVGHIETE